MPKRDQVGRSVGKVTLVWNDAGLEALECSQQLYGTNALQHQALVPSAQQHLPNCAPREARRSRRGDEPQCLSYFPILRTQQRTTDLQTVWTPCGAQDNSEMQW